jgi:2-polyprenyl-3-methyl-5-hydroxy-6-metoxy-1,4-benzoquinol methylase
MNPQDSIVRSEHGYMVFDQVPTQEYLNDYYSRKYYQNPQGTYQTKYSLQEETQRKLRIQLFEEFINVHKIDSSQSENSFLDVGCGEGFVLSHFKSMGWEVTGIDFSVHGVRENNPDLESFIIQGDIYLILQNLKESCQKYDLIFLGNVLEHVLNPAELIDSLIHLLNPGGLLCITVPNDFSDLQESYIKDGVVTTPYWLAFPDHLNYFNLNTLEKFLSDRNLKVLDHFCDFPIEWFLANPKSNYVNEPNNGRAAHLSRVMLDQMINVHSNKEAKLAFWRSLAELGFGRAITVISTREQF